MTMLSRLLLILALLTGAAHAQTISGRPGVETTRLTPKSTIACQDGDSLTNFGQTNSQGTTTPWTPTSVATDATTPANKPTGGWQFWAETRGYGQILFPQSVNFGRGGQAATGNNALTAMIDPAYLLAKRDACIAAGGSFMTIWIGTNDFTSSATAVQVTDAITTAANYYKAAGLKIVLITNSPRGYTGNTTYALSAANLKAMLAARQWMLQQRNTGLAVAVVDMWSAFADPGSTVGYWASSANTDDGIHFSVLGVSRAAKLIMAAMAPLAPPPPNLLTASNADLYDATNNPTGVITLNPALTGTTGFAAGTNGSGSLPTSWGPGASPSTRSGYSVVFSQPTTTDASTGITKQWLQLAYTGTPTSSGQHDSFQQDISVTTYPAGTRLQCSAEVQYDAGIAGILAVRFGLEGARTGAAGNGTYFINYAGQGTFSTALSGTEAFSGLMITEPYTIPSDVTGNYRLRLRVDPIVNNLITGTVVRIRNAGCQKLSALSANENLPEALPSIGMAA